MTGSSKQVYQCLANTTGHDGYECEGNIRGALQCRISNRKEQYP